MINLFSVLILLACISLMTAMVRESTRRDAPKHNH